MAENQRKRGWYLNQPETDNDRISLSVTLTNSDDSTSTLTFVNIDPKQKGITSLQLGIGVKHDLLTSGSFVFFEQGSAQEQADAEAKRKLRLNK